MEYELINQESPEVKALFEEMNHLREKIQEIAQSHRPVLNGERYLSGREVCERLFIRPRTLQDYRDRGLIPFTQLGGRILYRSSDLESVLQEHYSKQAK